MATKQVPGAHRFDLIEGMQLQISVCGSAKERSVRLEFQLKNCARTWILHWGCTYRGNKNWYVPYNQSSCTRQGALQTPFVKRGESYVITIELRDPEIHAIEFVLKDSSRDRWLKLNHGNFRIEIPMEDVSSSHPAIPRELVERKAYEIWERRGRPMCSAEQQKQDYDNALRELQSQLFKGISLNESRSIPITSGDQSIAISTEQSRNRSSYSCRRRHHIDQWIQKGSSGHTKSTGFTQPCLMELVEKSIGGDNVISKQIYHVGNYEIAVLTKNDRGDCHVVVAVNIKGSTVLHWGISKLSPGEWLAPPPDTLPDKSKLVAGACQTYFSEISSGKGFQAVDINFQQRDLVGIQFVIWSGGSWIKNNGANFVVALKPLKANTEGEGIVKWLLDEISLLEKEAERSLMHRYNIAAELTERSKNEGELGLVGVMVWMRFMACRQLTWNKNYNVKPREISEAQNRFTNLLQRIYLIRPNCREIVRLILASVGRGGQGDVGQRIRDEILVIQRYNDCKGGMMEEWHQKLHNNSSPEDVIICEALINYIKSDFRLDVYWRTLNDKGLTKEKLASYDRPILSEPYFRKDNKEGLVRDLMAYLKTLKAVHSGVDLEFAIDICLGCSSKGHNSGSTHGLRSAGCMPAKLQECLNFVKAHVGDKNIGLLMEKLMEARIDLRPLLLISHESLKDFLFLDLALDSTVRTTMERGLHDLNPAQPLNIMFFIALVLENLCLSSVNNEDLVYCTKDWYRICESYKSSDVQWALQTKALLDRLRLVLSDRSQHYHKMFQPSARYLGKLLSVEKGVIDIFTEEIMRSGTAAILSTLINRFDPILRKIANLGCWQVISPVEVSGSVTSVDELATIQSKRFGRPTIVLASRVTGEEEIPEGVVAVLTPDMPDVLSHIAIRARNTRVCFATCFDQNIFRDLKVKEGKTISIQLRSSDIVISDISSRSLSFKRITIFSIPRGLALRKKAFAGKYAISMEEFTNKMVGAKSCNLQFLRGRVPSWIKIPMSVALPFGVFEVVLSEDLNKDTTNKVSYFSKLVRSGDLSKLQAIQESVLQMRAPFHLVSELRNKMKSLRMPWPGDEGEERWNCAWKAIKKVWASKWNQRAYVSCKKENINHDNICMSVLIQEVICADYAFVIHTKNPLSGDTSEMYTELVKGLGETLVGAYPGRAMSFVTKKTNLKSPTVIGYPSKNIGLFCKKSIMFRSDSNCEDLEGYAGAGLYDSVLMEQAEKIVLDYSQDHLIVNKAFQMSLFPRIAEVGKIIEGLYGRPQDIEGVIKDGEIYVVQSRPQI